MISGTDFPRRCSDRISYRNNVIWGALLPCWEFFIDCGNTVVLAPCPAFCALIFQFHSAAFRGSLRFPVDMAITRFNRSGKLVNFLRWISATKPGVLH
jgi:hypothetical protein